VSAIERVDPEDDGLRIALDQLLERDLIGVGIAGRDGVGAGQGHHLGQERLVRRREYLAGAIGVPDLVVDALLGARLGGLGRGGVGVTFMSARMASVISVALSDVPVAVPIISTSLSTPATDGA
jgi:hypothetical protein